MFKDVTKHLNDSHVKSWEIPMLEGQKNIWKARLGDRRGNFEPRDDESSWSPGKMTSTYGDVFFFESKMSNNSVHCWVNFLGSSNDAKNFRVNFSVKSMNLCETFIYNGLVHTLEKEQSDIVDDQTCFSIKLNAVRRCLTSCNGLHIIISIRNINGQMEREDHGESDESEEKFTAKKRRFSFRPKTEAHL